MEVAQRELICAVQAHPQIWDLAHPLHADHHAKQREWAEIGASLVPGWEAMTVRQQQDTIKTLQKRWKSLRDRVRRDITEESRGATSGAPAPKKKREHVHACNLGFLRESMLRSSRETTSNIAEEEQEVVDRATTSRDSDITRPSSPQGSDGASLSQAPEHEEPIASQETGEMATRSVRGPGRGRCRGRGQQAASVAVELAERRDAELLSLLREVRQERRSVDPFLDPQNACASFCRTLYHVLQGVRPEEQSECMGTLFSVATQYRVRNLPSGFPYTQPPPTSYSTSAVTGPPYFSYASSVPPCQVPPPPPPPTDYVPGHDYGPHLHYLHSPLPPPPLNSQQRPRTQSPHMGNYKKF